VFLTRLSAALRRQDWPTVTVEFLLVVLGVLLALQLDNWNERRKDRALFEDYLVQLQADLHDDIEQAERRIEVPDDVLRRHLTPEQRREAGSSDLHVMSVTVTAVKPG